MESIIDEVENAVSQGFIEITLLGQNVNSYKTNLGKFPELLQAVSNVKGVKRIRYTSPHPQDMDENLLQVMQDNDNICNYVHLPLQAGSDRILKRMNRTYDKKEYLDLVEKIRQYLPESSISTDIIVGFPGETSADFEKTYNFIEQLKINYLHVFSYSNRTGTIASELKNQIPKDVKILRSRSLQKLSNKMRFDFYKNNINKVRKVLFESIVDNEYIVGFTDNYIRVMVKGDKNMIKKIFNVKLLFVGEDKVFGEIY